MSNPVLQDVENVIEVLVGPVVQSALGPIGQFISWLQANKNVDKAQAIAQLNVFVAQEQVALLQGAEAGVQNLVALGAGLAQKVSADVSAKVAAAQAALAQQAAPKAA